jgi:hypothetical protein
VVAGYGGQLTPDPDCWIINSLITFQTICSLMLDYTMLGLVYARRAAAAFILRTCTHAHSLLVAGRCRHSLYCGQCQIWHNQSKMGVHICRFSSPVLRAWSIRFSKNLFMHVMNDQLMLSLRVGNVRSKTFLNPSARLVLAMEVDDLQYQVHPEDGRPLCLVVRNIRPAVPFVLLATPLSACPTSSLFATASLVCSRLHSVCSSRTHAASRYECIFLNRFSNP